MSVLQRPIRHSFTAAFRLGLALMLVSAAAQHANATHLPKENFRRTVSQGLPDGRVFGFDDGYLDGWQLTYRANFNNKVTNRAHLIVYPARAPIDPARPRYIVIFREAPQVPPGPYYISAYHRGYEQAYNQGYGAGRRDGRDADRSDIAAARAALACRMDRTVC